jgi:hypothetical protein
MSVSQSFSHAINVSSNIAAIQAPSQDCKMCRVGLQIQSLKRELIFLLLEELDSNIRRPLISLPISDSNLASNEQLAWNSSG